MLRRYAVSWLRRARRQPGRPANRAGAGEEGGLQPQEAPRGLWSRLRGRAGAGVAALGGLVATSRTALCVPGGDGEAGPSKSPRLEGQSSPATPRYRLDVESRASGGKTPGQVSLARNYGPLRGKSVEPGDEAALAKMMEARCEICGFNAMERPEGLGGPFANTLGRKDHSSLHYSVAGCAPQCQTCNIMLGNNLTPSELVEKLQKVNEYSGCPHLVCPFEVDKARRDFAGHAAARFAVTGEQRPTAAKVASDGALAYTQHCAVCGAAPGSGRGDRFSSLGSYADELNLQFCCEWCNRLKGHTPHGYLLSHAERVTAFQAGRDAATREGQYHVAIARLDATVELILAEMRDIVETLLQM